MTPKIHTHIFTLLLKTVVISFLFANLQAAPPAQAGSSEGIKSSQDILGSSVSPKKQALLSEIIDRCASATEFAFGRNKKDKADEGNIPAALISYEDLQSATQQFIDQETQSSIAQKNSWLNPLNVHQADFNSDFVKLTNLSQDNSWNPASEGRELTTGSEPVCPFVQKLTVPVGSKICFMGDLHGSVHSMLRNLSKLKELGHIDDTFKILSPNFYFIFLGDFLDRGRYGTEVVYTWLQLKLNNPNHVFLVRGNHEDRSFSGSTATGDSFMKELSVKYPDASDKTFKTIWKIFEFSPFALYVKTNNQGATQEFIQCCHGGIEPGFDPRPFLASDKLFSYLGYYADKPKKIDLFYIVEDDKYKMNLFQGFHWSDFCNAEENTKIIKNSIHLGGHSNCYMASVTATTDYLNQVNKDSIFKLRGFFRGHQDQVHGCKMLFTPDKAELGQDIPEVENAEKSKYPYPQGPYHWTDVTTQYELDESDNGFKLGGLAPVFTFSSATEGQGVSDDCFGIVTTSESYDTWQLKIHEEQKTQLKRSDEVAPESAVIE